MTALVAGGLLACAGGGPVVPSLSGQEAWIEVSADRRSFTPTEGTVIEVAGAGRLAFLDGRRTIRVPEDLDAVAADGGEVEPGLFSGKEIRVLDDAGTVAWTFRSVPGMPAVPGTRIRDDDTGTASISSSRPVRFFLEIGSDGTTEFLHPETLPVSRVESQIQSVLDRYSGYGFSGVVAASRSSDAPPVVASAGHRAGTGSAPMDAATLFEIGSLTKQVTAAAVLELEDRGLLSLDDRLARWRPELPPRIGDVTLHHLLIHTSGLPEDADVPADDVEAVWSALAEVELQAPPGDEWEYSNLGYVALAAIVEETAEEGYRGLVEELIARSGVEDLGFPERHPAWSARYAVGGSGPLGTGRITERRSIEPRGWDGRLGASGLVGAVPALHDWFRALREGRVLSPAATARMFEERPPEIAYGWFYLRDADGSVQIAHGGDTQGFQTYLTYLPAEDAVLALGINDRRGWRGPLLRALNSIVAGDSVPDLPPAVTGPNADAVASPTGEYELPDGSHLTADTAGRRLRLSASGPDAIAMLTGAGHALADSLSTASRGADEFVEDLLRGDTAAVEAVLAPSGRSDSFWRIWDHLTSDHGDRPTRHRVLGTIPDRAGRLVSFVRISFDDGDETLRLVWRPHLDGWGTGGELPTRDFWPTGDGRFVSFDPTRPGWVEVRFEGAGSGALVDRVGRRAIRSAAAG